MEALDLLLTRSSNPHLTTPAPSGEQLNNICRAGLRAPDHGGLRPWRHVIVAGDGLERLSSILVMAASQTAPEQAERAARKPFRAPMIIITVVRYSDHPKVPREEQMISAGCAVHAMQQAAVAQGFGGMWRTGGFAYDPTVHRELGLADNESIVGFLYLGTPKVKKKPAPQLPLEEYFTSL